MVRSMLAQYLTNAGGKLFFLGNDGVFGRELWTSDGTPGGTVLVKDIAPGGADSEPRYFTAMGGALYFMAEIVGSEIALWKSDGTAGGTTKILAFPDAGTYPPSEMAAAGSRVFVTVGANATGWELWASDGTDASTHMIKDIVPSTAGGVPTWLTAAGDKLFFTAWSTGAGRELWVSDGTEIGTALVLDIRLGLASSTPAYLTNAGGTLVFAAAGAIGGYELWASDGTSAGTNMVQDIAPGSANATPADFVIVGQHLFFSAEDNIAGRELWALLLQALSKPTQPEISSSAGLVGASGSYFPLVAAGFLPQSPVTIAVDDVPIGRAITDANGGYQFTLFFNSAMPPGSYIVSVSETSISCTMAAQPRVARIEITIDPAGQRLPNPKGAPVINSRPTVYLPVITR